MYVVLYCVGLLLLFEWNVEMLRIMALLELLNRERGSWRRAVVEASYLNGRQIESQITYGDVKTFCSCTCVNTSWIASDFKASK